MCIRFSLEFIFRLKERRPGKIRPKLHILHTVTAATRVSSVEIMGDSKASVNCANASFLNKFAEVMQH